MASPNQFPKLRDSTKPLETRTQDNVSATLTPIATRLNATPIMGAPPPAWIRPDYAADLVDAAGFQQTAYHRDALGYTWLKIGASTAAGVGALATLFTLAQGYRPSETISLAQGVNGATGAFNPIIITPAGVVQTIPAIGAGQSVLGYFSFLAAT